MAPSDDDMMLAGVEGGGTTWVCALAAASAPSEILDRATFETGPEPEATLAQVAAWLEARTFDALGIATFGPVDPRRGSPRFGHITATPKPGWQYTDVVGRLTRPLDPAIPVAFDTDVNAPAVAEARAYNATTTVDDDDDEDDASGAHGPSSSSKQVTSLAYVTVGTGVGVGLFVNGAPVHGFLHPEAGHVPSPLHDKDETYDPSGLTSLACPGWHEIEAMVATKALSRRAKCAPADLEHLPDDHAVWDVAAHYLASLVATLVLVVSPQRIVLSGGVMQRASLFPKVRERVVRYLNGYIPDLDADACRHLVVPSRWRNDAGIVGALVLAKDALLDKQRQRQRGDARDATPRFSRWKRHGWAVVWRSDTATRSCLVAAALVSGLVLGYWRGSRR